MNSSFVLDTNSLILQPGSHRGFFIIYISHGLTKYQTRSNLMKEGEREGCREEGEEGGGQASAAGVGWERARNLNKHELQKEQ